MGCSLIFGVMEDMEVRGRFSMQFESDLQKVKDVPAHVRSNIQQTVPYTVPYEMQPASTSVAVPPSVESGVHMSELSNSSPESDNELITFAGQSPGLCCSVVIVAVGRGPGIRV